MNKTGTDFSSAVLMFNWVEYSVFGSMLIFSLLIGVYFGWFKKQNTVAEYLLGGKKMGVFPVTMSLVFSHVSGVTLLGIPAEIYSYGTQYIAIAFCNIAMLFLVNYLFLPVFFDLQLNSLYEYLELRFSKGTRTFASLIFAISLVIFIPVVIYVPALAFNQVTGVSVHIISPIVSLICIFYTSFGGLKAVLWTDTLQGVFTLSSTMFIAILGLLRVGSIQEVWRINDEGGRLEFLNFDLNPFERNTFWTVSVGSVFFWLAQIAVHPGAVQRFIAVSTIKESKAVMFWSFIGFFVIKSLVVCIGLLLYATYHDCDPVAIKMAKKTSQILPYYVMDVARDFPGLTGLFISGVLSAALSTMSAGLNTVAGTLYEDFVQFVLKGEKLSEASQSLILKVIVLVLGLVCDQPHYKCCFVLSTMSAGLNTVAGTLYEDFVQFVLKGEKLSEASQSLILKVIVLVLGLVCVALVFIVEKLGALFQMALSLIGVTNGALVGVFCLGLFFPRANSKGAIAGGVASLLGMSGIVFGAQWYIARGLLKFPGKVTSVAGCPANLTASLGFNASANVQTWTGYGTPVVADESVALIFQLSYMHYCLVGCLIVFLVGLPVSYLTSPQDLSSMDPHLFSPPIRRFLPQRRRTSVKPSKEDYFLVSTEPSTKDVKEHLQETQITGA
ncbi:putative sodium-dependent multivitamin transporter [Macrosteles quadrilineatus]|uniref:putative sodium-dependent multivitamin transporter n=1 Tax=Macrosteles quadrilineatus TaxID=74068 RepID=UPI0023E1F35A|nr:putative sodium-dependent multivitamin transporter [Macrosteles quadrilineatus]